MASEKEFLELVNAHSIALGFVREIAAQHCPAPGGCTCLPCRAHRWLYSVDELDVTKEALTNLVAAIDHWRNNPRIQDQSSLLGWLKEELRMAKEVL